MQLHSDFTYIDSKQQKWHVPAGATVDGASIPKPLWSLIGGPFEGKYREASVVHDYYCENKQRTWENTHNVFFEAMLTSGEAPRRAKLMYWAVYRFGPRWTEQSLPGVRGARGLKKQKVFTSKPDAAEIELMKQRIEREDMSAAELASDAQKRRVGDESLVCSETTGPGTSEGQCW